LRTQESPPLERWSPLWMWGRATFTTVVSSTTMSWAVRMTKRNTEGRWRRPEGPAGAGTGTGSGRVWLRGVEGIDFDLSAGILKAEASSG
jgi:hypothetical protein